MRGNPYIPVLARISDVREETYNVRTFRLVPIEDGFPRHRPGQFLELTVFGYGEAPFSISSPPGGDGVEVTVRLAGNVTRALFRLGKGGVVGIRGPFGNGWPLDRLRGRDVLIIAGGIGLAPLKPLVEHIIAHRDEYGEVSLLYGARTPRDRLYTNLLPLWGRSINVLQTVDVGDEEWEGRVGVVTILLDEVEVGENTVAVQCGPPIMMHFVTKKLVEMGLQPDRIYMSLERLMKCGMGFCGHCMVSGKYVCLDGPVFSYDTTLAFLEPAV